MPASPSTVASAVAAPSGLYASVLKRAIDVTLAVTVLIVLAPVMAVVAVLVWLVLGRPILYRDLRAGRDGRPFEIVKFRSMTERVDAAGSGLEVEVGAEQLERVLALLGLPVAVLARRGVVAGALLLARHLGDAVRDVADDVEPRDALLLEQVDRV